MTTQPTPAKNGLNALLTPQESVLVLIDHQPYQLAYRLLAFDQLAEDEQPMLVAHGLQKGARLSCAVLQLF